MDHAALDRILQRLVLDRGGTADSVAGRPAWDVALPQDPDQEGSPLFAFRSALTLDDGHITGIACEGPHDRYTKAQEAAIAAFQADLAAAIEREAKMFDSFADVKSFLVGAGAELDGEGIVIRSESEDDEPVYVTSVTVAREPWVSLSAQFTEEVSPEWLLEANASLTHLHFEGYEDGVSLACAFPLALLTRQRLLELIEDLFANRESLLAELAEGAEDEG